MSYVTSAWLEHRLRPDRQRLVCPDAAADEATARAAAEQEAVERELLELRWVVKSLRTDLALARLRQSTARTNHVRRRGAREVGAGSVLSVRPTSGRHRTRCGLGRLFLRKPDLVDWLPKFGFLEGGVASIISDRSASLRPARRI